MKCVITAAGKWQRLLPRTKEIPKEMMPIFTRTSDKRRVTTPLLQFIFQQMYDIGLRDYCFVVGREKRSIEDHFTIHEDYLRELSRSYKDVLVEFYQKLEKSNLVWINQNKPQGFGDAVKLTEQYIGKDDFIVHAGDVTILTKKKHPITKMAEIMKNNPDVSTVLFCKKVKDARRFGVPKLQKISSSQYLVEEVEEKPDKPKSNFALVPLYYFKSGIFYHLKRIKRGRGNEYQLTDAIQRSIENGEKTIAIPLENGEIEIDVGTVESYRTAQEISYLKA